METAAVIGANLMAKSVTDIETGCATFTRQPEGNYPRARVVSKHERFIDWDVWPIERVWHFMRGTYPWVDATDFPEHLKGKIRIGAMECCQCHNKPGGVFNDGDRYYVAHKDGKIYLEITKNNLLGSLFRRRPL